MLIKKFKAKTIQGNRKLNNRVNEGNLVNFFFNDIEIWIAFAHVSDLEEQSTDQITLIYYIAAFKNCMKL